MNQYNFFNITFEPILPIILILILLVILLFITFFTIFNRIQGGIYRILIFVIFFFLLIQPSLKIEKRKLENSILTFVIDDSLSQQVSGRSKNIDTIYKNMLRQINNKYNQFDILEIRINDKKITKRFGNINGILSNTLSIEEKKSESKYSTRLLKIFYEEINKYPTKKISTAFFLTDGQIHDLKESSIVDKIDIPIYYILPNVKNLNDQKLEVTYAPDYAYVGESVKIKVVANDYTENKKGYLKLDIFDPEQNLKEINLEKNVEETINFKINKIGENIFYLRIKPNSDDLSNSNNFKIVKINAIRKRLRVLLVSGEPYMGTRVWRNFLKSDPTVELVHMTVLRPPEKNDNTKISELSLIPFPVKELFEEKLKNFNLIIFDNFRGRNILTPLYYENLIGFVEKGGAILEITGPSYNSRNSLFRTQVGKILPGAPTGKSLRGEFKPELTELGKKHPITKSIFKNLKNYGSWYEMNDVLIDNKETSVLLKGLKDKPLLSIKKIDKGRISQIYSHNIWIWKNNILNPGPYRELIKNLAHWLMKEPELEEDELKVSIKGKKVFIKKTIFKENDIKNSSVFIYGPQNNKEKLILNKKSENTFSNTYEIKKEGIYLVMDNSQVQLVETNNYSIHELENLDINYDFLDATQPISLISKVIKTSNGTDIKYRVVEDYTVDKLSTDKVLLPKNLSYQVNEIIENKLFNVPLFLVFIIGLFFASWKRES